jgi:hypothetical protein
MIVPDSQRYCPASAAKSRCPPGVEGHPPGVAEAVGVDLVPSGSPDERVVRRDTVGLRAIDVDPEDLPEQRPEVLPVPSRRMASPDVAGAAAVAERDVEVAVGAEGDRTAVVVRLGLVDLEDHPLGVRVRPVGRGGPELRYPARVVPAHRRPVPERGAVVDEEPPVLPELRVEREAEEPALVVAGAEVDDPVGDIEEGLIGADDPDDAGEVRDEEPPGPVGGGRERDGHDESPGDRLEAHPPRSC